MSVNKNYVVIEQIGTDVDKGKGRQESPEKIQATCLWKVW